MTGRLLILGLALAAAAAFALDPPERAPVPAAAVTQQDASSETVPQSAPSVPKATAPPAQAEDEQLPPLPAGTRPTGPTPQRFNPTEKVRADFPVSFPIDI